MSGRNSPEASPEEEWAVGGEADRGQVLQDLGGGRGRKPGFYSERTEKAAGHFQAGELHDLVAVRRSRARFKIGKRATAVFVGQKWPSTGNCLRLNLIPVLLDRPRGQEHRLNKAAGPATTTATSESARGNGR